MYRNRVFALFVSLALVTVTLLAYGASAPAAARSAEDTEILKFDIAENGTSFVPAEKPVFGDGQPAYGNPFITEGYIYPAGTLNGSNGTLKNGAPEFPDKVLGNWICRGWHIGDGAHTKTGPWTVTTQIFDLGKQPGITMLVSDGFELVDMHVPFERAITGGTGE